MSLQVVLLLRNITQSERVALLGIVNEQVADSMLPHERSRISKHEQALTTFLKLEVRQRSGFTSQALLQAGDVGGGELSSVHFTWF